MKRREQNKLNSKPIRSISLIKFLSARKIQWRSPPFRVAPEMLILIENSRNTPSMSDGNANRHVNWECWFRSQLRTSLTKTRMQNPALFQTYFWNRRYSGRLSILGIWWHYKTHWLDLSYYPHWSQLILKGMVSSLLKTGTGSIQLQPWIPSLLLNIN